MRIGSERQSLAQCESEIDGDSQNAITAATAFHLLLFGGTLERNSSFFSGRKRFNPLVLRKAPFPLPELHTTFVISHNVCNFRSHS